MSDDRQALANRLQIKPGDVVSRFKCRYKKVWTDEFGELDVCEIHGEWSPYDFEFGPYRPCKNAQLDDKLPLTITQFLGQIAYESTKKAENSVLAEDHTRIAEMIQIILTWHEQWPVLVYSEPKFEEIKPDGDINQVMFRMTQQMDWLTTKAYKEKFGTESPVAPLIRQLAQQWDDHPEFRPEWRI